MADLIGLAPHNDDLGSLQVVTETPKGLEDVVRIVERLFDQPESHRSDARKHTSTVPSVSAVERLH